MTVLLKIQFWNVTLYRCVCVCMCVYYPHFEGTTKVQSVEHYTPNTTA